MRKDVIIDTAFLICIVLMTLGLALSSWASCARAYG